MSENSRSIDDLDPRVQPMAKALIAAAAGEGIRLMVTRTYASIAYQNMLYSLGRTLFTNPLTGQKYKRGETVTNAKGGDSWHNWRLAFDVVPLKDNGTADWDSVSPAAIRRWHRIGQLGKECGLEWGGDWHSIVDLPHFQATFGNSLAAMKKGAV
jgi:peptidoglycan L-alanyl-D-glutamate endopeptidase CwlK